MTVTTFMNRTDQSRECSPFNLSCTGGAPPPGGWWQPANKSFPEPDSLDDVSALDPFYVANAEQLHVTPTRENC